MGQGIATLKLNCNIILIAFIQKGTENFVAHSILTDFEINRYQHFYTHETNPYDSTYAFEVWGIEKTRIEITYMGKRNKLYEPNRFKRWR